MLNKSPLICGAIALLIGQASAKEPRNDSPSVAYARFPLPIEDTYISASPGTPSGKALMPDGPFPDDYPPHTTIAFEDAREFPAFKKGPRYFIRGRNTITVYRITEVERAPYKGIQLNLERLKRLLKDRPKDVPLGKDRHSLPDFPQNTTHTFQLKLTYVDTAWGSGLFYLTQFSQESHLDFANNETLTYVFQGLSKDGNFYVSACFRITHPELPAGIDSKPKHQDPHQRADSIFLTKQTDGSFTPSLSAVRDWIAKLKFE